jgi:hypothetical protein
MPIPTRKKNQSLKDYTADFMSDPEMIKEFPDSKQRYAVMFKKYHESLSSVLTEKPKDEPSSN